ncbi:MAG: DNA adenine methylase [Coriobacteriia bacterium]|nr:DNA adenine methylase [Coriobacteriia bacterium]
MIAKPFIKWAGGKSQLLADIQKKYPAGLGKSINRYCEPFVGGGAVLFDVLSKYQMEDVLINDVNRELINAYIQIKHHVDDLIDELDILQTAFWAMSTEERKTFYYDKRDKFNCIKMNGDERANLEKAALFIFLNRTCFNGLFRVNGKGLFNVPIGSYKRPAICDADNLKRVSCLLQNVTIKCGDYKECLPFVNRNTFVYIDPPYRPITQTSSFTAYAETAFNDKEQIELGEFVDNLHLVGAKIVVSNSDPKNTNQHDDFFDELYSPYKIERVSAKRMINCNGDSRGKVSELLISNC